MRQTAKPHPTDARDQEWIANADHFTAFCKRGPFDRRKSQHATQAEAEKAGLELSAALGGNAALIYAVTKEGRSAFVKSVTATATATPAPQEGATMTTTAKSYSTKGNATKAARAALGPDARFTTDKGPFGWTWAPWADDAQADPVLDTMAQLDAAEAASALFADADDKATADEALAADPLVVNGVTFPNKARADEARRLAKDAAKRPAKVRDLSRVSAADAQASVTAKRAARKAADQAPAATAPKAAQGKRAQQLADAEAGKLPTPPSTDAPSNAKYAGKVAEVVALVAAGDVPALLAHEIKTISSFPKALDRYRQLAAIALKARAAKGGAA